MITAAFIKAAMNMTGAAVIGICLGIACFHFFIASVANVLEGTLLALRLINHLLLLFSALRGLLKVPSLLQTDLKFKMNLKVPQGFRMCVRSFACLRPIVFLTSSLVSRYRSC